MKKISFLLFILLVYLIPINANAADTKIYFDQTCYIEGKIWSLDSEEGYLGICPDENSETCFENTARYYLKIEIDYSHCYPPSENKDSYQNQFFQKNNIITAYIDAEKVKNNVLDELWPGKELKGQIKYDNGHSIQSYITGKYPQQNPNKNKTIDILILLQQMIYIIRYIPILLIVFLFIYWLNKSLAKLIKNKYQIITDTKCKAGKISLLSLILNFLDLAFIYLLINKSPQFKIFWGDPGSYELENLSVITRTTFYAIMLSPLLLILISIIFLAFAFLKDAKSIYKIISSLILYIYLILLIISLMIAGGIGAM